MNIAESLKFILPETILTISGIVILLWSLFAKNKSILGVLTLLGVALAGLALKYPHSAGEGLFFNMLANDPFSLFFKTVCLFVTAMIVLISMGYKALPSDHAGEYYFLLLVGTVAMLLAVSSDNLIMIYISLEMLSLVSYMLVGYFKYDSLSSEGALKYFIFGAVSTAIMLYGISLIYGLFGTTDLSSILSALSAGKINGAVATLLLILILAGLSFKCALVPFHMWAPDVYQGAPTAVTAFISVGPKAAGFAILARIFLKSFLPLYGNWAELIAFISILTMTIGNIIAISQTNIKRMLAYSSIAQAGYVLIGFAAGSIFGIDASLYYILAYAFMNLGAFGCIILISNSTKSDEIADYAGLHKIDPIPAFLLAVFLLSLAGVPPLAGFVGKFMVFASAVQANLIMLAIAGVLNAVVAAYYYFNVIRQMYLCQPKSILKMAKPLPLQIALAAALAGVFAAGLYPQPFLNWINLAQTFMRP